jgi:AraC family transcriptional activator of pobA
MTTTALHTLYQESAPCTSLDLNTLLPGGIRREVGV